MKENNCDKVNIIAHSKGGLDARYLITTLSMGEHVASLTSISTPHRGSELIHFLNKLPDGVYRFLASLFDRSFAKVGDENPDCYHSSKQLAPTYCEEFNNSTPDVEGVYYQSYTSTMKNIFSDSLLCIPYILMSLLTHQPNDGLVTIDSAKWGAFKGVFTNKYHRGITHGDMIDLKREDYHSFDILEEYCKIVSELREKGY